jgi:DNA repair exonuclease SbcCD ATPase subunit
VKILSVNLSNFASYKELEFNLDDKGLVLIHGATGSGKSTLMDAIPWGLFGRTSKGGNADEVLSWTGGQTWVRIRMFVNGKYLCVDRKRGPNDLWYATEESSEPKRGKDLQDTQKLINELLGFDYDMYMASAYYHEFSQTAQFFTTTAKNRRQITEQLVDLSLPLKLSESIKADQKQLKAELLELDKTITSTKVGFGINTEALFSTFHQSKAWGLQQATKVQSIQLKSDNFEVVKGHRIKALQQAIIDIGYEPETANYTTEQLEADLPAEFEPCITCGTPKVNHERQATLEVIKDIKEDIKLHKAKGLEVQARMEQLESLSSSINTYQEQVNSIKQETNPHTANQLRLEKEVEKYEKALYTNQVQLNSLKDQELNLELLSDAVTTLRSELVKTTIESLETQTNQLLQDHFESEIQVSFNIAESDKLEVSITKDSNEASYTQLSKGQRGILKLAFGCAIMKTISKHNNLDIKQLFFDESLDGLSEELKLKAVRLFETLALEYETVYIVDHSSEVKAHIDQKYLVTLINGVSNIEQV